MSFYQPSLSLYDVLNALSNQAPTNRDPRGQLFINRGYSPLSSAYGSFGNGVPSSFPPGLIYRLPGDTCYYRPDYYYTGEDEDEDQDEDEELEEAERAQRFQQQQQQEQRGYEHLPSYYHSRAPKGGVQEALEESDPLTELLGNLLGSNSSIPTYERPPQVPSRRNTADEDNLFKQALLDKLGQQVQEDSSAAKVSSTAEKEEKQDQQDPISEKGNEVEEQAPPKPKERLPFPLNRKPSLLGAQSGSSAPGGPLQVSKPEARLDLPFSPEVNVYDCPDQYVVAVALPGATSKGFKVDYHPSNHELILKGDIEDKLGISEEYLKVTELKYGAFQRTIKFPVTPRIRDEEIKASYKNGILQVKVPKILESNEKPAPKKRIIIEDVPDEELEYEEHHSLPLQS